MELLALVFLWEGIQLEIPKRLGFHRRITCSGICMGCCSTQGAEKLQIPLPNYLHPSRLGLKSAVEGLDDPSFDGLKGLGIPSGIEIPMRASCSLLSDQSKGAWHRE